jgi:trigger factor
VVQAGDFALIDFTATADGKEFPGSKNENVTVEVAPGELINSQIAALEGVKVGDTKELDYAFPADYRVEEVKGKTAQFKIHVKSLKAKIVPELNDELAKEVQGGNTLDELKAKIRADLERSSKQKVEQEQREELIKQLVAKNTFEVPKAMVDRAIDMMLEGALRQMQRSGVDLNQLGLDFDKLREEMRPRALSEVQGTLLFEAIAEKEKIEASDVDVEKKIEALAEELGQPLHKIQKHFKSPDERRGLSLRLREEKTVEFLKGSATYSD